MTAVKASKQYEMVVVPYRPWYRAAVFSIFIVAVAALGWLTYDFGLNKGVADRVQAIKDRDKIKQQLADSEKKLESQRQQIADLKVGNQVDTKANEEVRQTIASLQSQIADLNEQISFYKAVMLPNADEKGLRIERLDVKSTGQPGQYHFNLLLTQIVDKHNYIDGSVQMTLIGTKGAEQATIPVATDGTDNGKFRFRYFQNIDGDVTLPEGFTPTQFDVVAQSSGRGAQKIERKFQWNTGEG